MEIWVGLIGALAGIALGGFITYRVASQQRQHERQTESERRLITACESIHELLSQISEQASMLSMGVVGDLGYGTKLKGNILKDKVQLNRLRMLVDFYTPSLQSDIESIVNQFTIISRAVTETILQMERKNSWKSKTVESTALASVELTKLSQAAQSKLADIVRLELAND